MKMELWIRSQDKTKLVKVNSLWIMDNQIWMEVPFYENHKKLGLTASGCNHKLATYTTKERAIEVLDEIQNKINLINLGHDFGSPMIDFKNQAYIYQMPAE